MNDFLQIVRLKNGFESAVKEASLQELYALRSDASFGTKKYETKQPALQQLSKEFGKIHAFAEEFGKNRMPLQVSTAWFHRTLCAVKALELWKKYRREYVIDKDWYQDFITTEDTKIDFSMLQKLPYDSFYVNLENLGILSTNHYRNVIGVIVNVMNTDTLHLTVIDSDNVQYNPVQYYGSSDLRIVKMRDPKQPGKTESFALAKKDFSSAVYPNTNMTYGEFISKYGSYKEVRDCFPENWKKYDTGTVHFVDFEVNKNAQNNVLSGISDNADTCFGWKMQYDGVIEGIDLKSQVINQIMRFIIPFLYFLHSKTEDITYRKTGKEAEQKTDPSQLIEKWDVGIRYGQKIRSLQRKCKIYGAETVCGGENEGVKKDRPSRPRAYVRCAHWHHYWCGSQADRHLELRWLEPTYCNGAITDIVTVMNEVSDADLKQSNGEHVIACYLDKMQVPYETEHVINIKGHNRRYDFLVSFQEKYLFIEFDGEQHFRPVEQFGGAEAFRGRRVADFDKNKYAKKQRIPLLRIRYDQITSVPELIDAFLEKPTINRLNPVLDNTKYYKVK